MELPNVPQPQLTARRLEVEDNLMGEWEPSETPTVPRVVLHWPKATQAV
jgi:hypothetical protein